jgi:hypothetical protein
MSALAMTLLIIVVSAYINAVVFKQIMGKQIMGKF